MKKIMMFSSIFLISILSLSHTINAIIGPVTVEGMVNNSDYIVIGKVDQVYEIEGVQVANVIVDTILKGENISELLFQAESKSACNTSNAKIGERALLFLRSCRIHEPDGFRTHIESLTTEIPFTRITGSGRGRMPIRMVNGQEFVTLDSYIVDLPDSIPTIDGPEEDPFRKINRSAPLELMIKLIKEVISEQTTEEASLLECISISEITSRKRSDLKQTMENIRAIGIACEEYYIDNNCYPKVQSIKDLHAFLVPYYLREIPHLDGWGNEFLFWSDGSNCTIRSLGQNEVQDNNPVGTFINLDLDIVFTNGKFTHCPSPRIIN